MELEEMRQQINILKEKLEHQQIVNEKIIRKALREKLQSVNRDKIKMRWLGIFSLTFCTLVFHSMNFPLWFVGVTAIVLIISLIAHEWAYKDINDNRLAEQSIVEVRSKAVQVKNINAQWLRIGFFLMIPWYAALIYATYQLESQTAVVTKERLIFMIVMYLLAGGIGGLFGYRNYLKYQRHVKDLIEETYDFTIDQEEQDSIDASPA